MAEHNSICDKAEEQNPMQSRRQEGDGNDDGKAESLNVLISSNASDFTPNMETYQEEENEEKVKESAEISSDSEEFDSVDDKISLNKKSEANSGQVSARANLDLESEKKIDDSLKSQLSTSPMRQLTQKELRQQLRQLHSQELIRRILQSSPKVKNFPSSQRLIETKFSDGKEKPAEDLLRPPSPSFVGKDLECPAKLNKVEQEQSKRKDLQVVHQTQPEGETTLAAMQSADQNLLDSCMCQQQQCIPVNDKTLEAENYSVQHDDRPCDIQSDSIASLDSGSTEVLDAGSQMREVDNNSVQSKSRGNQSKPQCFKSDDVDQQPRERMIQDQPTQENLSEILKLLKAQSNNTELQSQQQNFKSQTKTSEILQPAPPVTTFESVEGFGTSTGGTKHTVQSSLGTQNWNTVQPWQLIKSNAADMHERELSSLRFYYEAEIKSLTDQLELLRGNISSLQETMPLKMLETANAKLEGRCHLLEDVCNELQAKCQKYEHSCQELEVSCRQLSRANQNLEMRCLHLEQTNEALNMKHLNLSSNKQELEMSLLEMKTVNEKAAMVIQEQQQYHKDAEMKYLQLEDTRNTLEAKYKRYKDQNQVLERDIKQMQETLVFSTRHSEELEKLVSSLNSEKDEWKLKLDAAHKLTCAANQRLEEIKSYTVKKEKEVEQLQEQVKQLTRDLDRANKTKASMEAHSRQDKELLQKLLAEFDALSTDYKKSRIASQALEQKLNESQDEISELQGQIQRMAQRNLSLEESLRETIGHISSKWNTTSSWNGSPDSAARTHNSDSGVGSTVDPQVTQISGVLKHSPSKPPKLSSPANLSPNATGELLTSASPVWKTSTPLKKDKPSNQPMAGKIKPTKSPKKNLNKSFSSYSPTKNQSKSPGNMIVKQSDLVTRFDIVFEDSESGQEATQTRIGHSRRLYGYSAADERGSAIHELPTQQETTVNSVVERLGISDAERALNAIRAGRVTSYGDWEDKGTVTVERDKKNRLAKVYARNVRSVDGDGKSRERSGSVAFKEFSEEGSLDKKGLTIRELEKRFSRLMDEKKRLESTLSRIPSSRMTKRVKEDKAFLENRLDEVVKSIGSVRMQLRRYNAL